MSLSITKHYFFLPRDNPWTVIWTVKRNVSTWAGCQHIWVKASTRGDLCWPMTGTGVTGDRWQVTYDTWPPYAGFFLKFSQPVVFALQELIFFFAGDINKLSSLIQTRELSSLLQIRGLQICRREEWFKIQWGGGVKTLLRFDLFLNPVPNICPEVI